MKVLFLLDGLKAGGKERRALELMKGIKQHEDIAFKLVLMNKEIHYKQVFDLNLDMEYLIRGPKKDISVFYKFYKICKKFKPDIVHCWDSMTAVYAMPVCKLLHIQLINGMVIDAPVIRNFSNKEWVRAKLTFPFSSKIIGNSNAGLAAYNAPKKKSLCVYNGLDLTRFKNLRDPEEVRKEIFGDDSNGLYILGMVANFEKRKDYKTVVNAAIKIVSEYPEVRFVLVGGGLDLESIKSMVPESLRAKIIFLGKKSNVESIINIFNAGILLTNNKVHGEGVSNSIIEYMALAKPVIASNGGGTNEVVFDKENGYLIEPENETQLIEKIKLLKHDHALSVEMGKKGLQMIHEKFDLSIMTNNYLNIYQQLLPPNTSTVTSK